MLHISPKTQVLISLEPGIIVGRVVRGIRVIRTHHASFSLSEWASILENGLTALDEPLERIVTRLGVSPGAEATVVFECPTALAEFYSIGTGGLEAINAARLAAAERLGLPANSPCVGVQRLGRFKVGDERLSTQFIITAVPEAELIKVYRWTERANLNCRGVIPASAMLLDSLATRLLNTHSPEAVNLVHVDRCRSAVGSGNENGISMLRTFQVGTAHMAEAIMRASTVESKRLTPIPFDRAHAMLTEMGLPHQGHDYDEALSARVVLPYLQPVLQKFSVELKQSFRKLLRDSRMAQLNLQLTGPGATIDRLDTTLAGALDADVTRLQGPVAQRSGADVWADSHSRHLVLRSLADDAQRRVRGLGKAAIAGTIIAGLVVLGQLGAQARRIQMLDRSLAANAAEVAQTRQFRQLCTQAADTQARIGVARDLVETFVSDQPRWDSAIREVASMSTGVLSLTEIRGDFDERGASLILSGLSDAQSEPSPLSGFIAQLQQSPLFSAVEVTSRRLIEIDGKASHQFRLRLQLVRLPIQNLHAEADR